MYPKAKPLEREEQPGVERGHIRHRLRSSPELTYPGKRYLRTLNEEGCGSNE